MGFVGPDKGLYTVVSKPWFKIAGGAQVKLR